MTGEERLDVADLSGGEFDTVVIAGIDMYGRLTGKRIPVRRWKETAAEGLHICTCVYAWDFAQDLGALRVDYAGDHTGWHDFRLVPDVTTLRRAAWLDRTAIVLADSVEEHGDALVPVAPRSVLRAALDRTTAAGRRAFVATELEFHLYKGTPSELRARGHRDLVPTTDVHSDYNIIEGDLYEPFFGRLRAVLEASGVPVEVAQVEYGHGQWEINLEYADPLEMADRHALFKHVVRAVAARDGMTATFMPRPLTGGMGSSCHVHVSLQDLAGRPLFHDPGADRTVSATMRQAVGGVLHLAGDLMLLYAPTVNAMRRLRTQDFAGNGITWGYDNRTTTCRLITGAPAANRIEMRLPGADTNPYLAIAGVLASVGLGIDRELDPGPPLVGNGYAGSSPAGLPLTLGDAAAAFRASRTAREVLGDDVVEHYAAVGEHEWTTFLDAVSDWDRDRYLDSI
ncbi:glutamine synthetase family protein [Actinomadura welshii]|uniref:glutamine synthetase family protein n=1 Tax=Actinomadura welshii TaxID=3103817 RepID=UPI0003AD4EE6|nr:glutamine synthetase family protein [Actinomadura madurae]